MPPPVPSRPLGVRLLGNASATLVVELFLDLCCPFSRKMFATLNAEGGVFDQIRADASLSTKLECIFHNVPQPWHAQSPIMHESMFAVSLAVDHDAKLVVAYIKAAFDAFPSFQDKFVANKSRVEIQEMCTDIAAEELGQAVRSKVMSRLSFDHLSEEEPHVRFASAALVNNPNMPHTPILD